MSRTVAFFFKLKNFLEKHVIELLRKIGAKFEEGCNFVFTECVSLTNKKEVMNNSFHFFSQTVFCFQKGFDGKRGNTSAFKR